MLMMFASLTWAEDAPTMDHAHMDHSKMNHGDMKMQETEVSEKKSPPMDHSKMNHAEKGGAMDHSKMNHATMSHAEMSMQGSDTPENARDPHAYSDGETLHSLPFYHNDSHNLYSLLVDRLESVTTTGNAAMTYDLQAWVGQTYNRALIRAEGEMQNGKSENARTELLWAHAITPYWDSHLGVRYDSGSGHNRGWLALGVQGLAPYWLYTEATFYVNEQGRVAFRTELEYDVLITQRLILQPRIEANFYSKNDATHGLGNGLSNIEAGMRLRYEFRREFAPYIGVEWASVVGNTANYAKANGNTVDETRFVAGVHFWF
jgi:copper resistance protein B